MGNCTSKKSGKISKLSLSKLPIGKKMDKEPLGTKVESRGLSTKIAPTTKGTVTSFGFKRRSTSALPTPVTLTSRVADIRQNGESGSSVESLCHVASTSSPLVTPKAQSSSTPPGTQRKQSPSPSTVTANRFGFRSATPPRVVRQSLSTSTPRKSPNSRSKSADPRQAREAFFREAMQPAESVNSVVGSQANLRGHPGKFYLQTSQLPRPQYPTRLSDKTFKTVTNYCRRDGPLEERRKEESGSGDSGLRSLNSNSLGETTLRDLELHGSSPAPLTRGRSARKLELRMVNGNKFELLDKDEKGRSGPVPFVRAPRPALTTGLVQQRTEQYLQRITAGKDSNRLRPTCFISPATSPGEGMESEEEKLKKDASRSEKFSSIPYLMTDGAGENDEFLPGEAMADDVTLSFSSDEDLSSVGHLDPQRKGSRRPNFPNMGVVAIRTDAMRLSNQLKRCDAAGKTQVDDSCFGLLNADERTALDEDTLLELSSESDSMGDKDKGAEKGKEVLNVSTDGPDTPSNASLSEGRDFLIDDEIADQPQLCFSTHEDVIADMVATATGNNNDSDVVSLAVNGGEEDQEVREGRTTRRVSVGTLSPCESLMSDDLMMDFDNSGAEDNAERCRGLGDNDDNVSVNGVQRTALKHWSSLPKIRVVEGANGKLGNSAGSSPLSLRSGVSRTSTNDDFSVRLDKNSYQHMFQDIVAIKSMLLKLNRVLSENDSSLDAFSEEDSAADLKKQVAFLQQQLQQREASLHSLQTELNRNVDRRTSVDAPVLCNAATQTDKVRPMSTGPSILQNLPSESNNVTSNGHLRKVADWIEENNKNILAVRPADKNSLAVRVAPADKILEKVKELSFKPVDVLEREQSERRACTGKNVFKITKIDLVLKSGNYGQSELRKS